METGPRVTHRTEPVVDPRTRRANREKAVAIVGSKGATSWKLRVTRRSPPSSPARSRWRKSWSRFGISGGWPNFPGRENCFASSPSRATARRCLWAIDHADELGDADSFYAYLLGPDYALGLKQLAAGAAEPHARRSHQTEVTATRPPGQGLTMLVGVGLLSFVGIVLWRHRQSSMA